MSGVKIYDLSGSGLPKQHWETLAKQRSPPSFYPHQQEMLGTVCSDFYDGQVPETDDSHYADLMLPVTNLCRIMRHTVTKFRQKERMVVYVPRRIRLMRLSPPACSASSPAATMLAHLQRAFKFPVEKKISCTIIGL